jgi:hypothetical protein
MHIEIRNHLCGPGLYCSNEAGLHSLECEMTGFLLIGAAFLASVLVAYIVAAAECGAWPFHRL